MKKRLSVILQRLKRLTFYKKKTFYVILTVLFSLILLADVAVAIFVPTQSMDFGNMGNNFPQMSDFREGSNEDSENGDSQSEDSESDESESDASGMPGGKGAGGRMMPGGSESGEMTMPEGSDSGKMTIPEGSSSGEMAMPEGSESGEMMMPEGSESGEMTMPEGSESGEMMMSEGSESGEMTMPEGSDSGEMTMPGGSSSGEMTMPEGSDSGEMTMPEGSDSGEMTMPGGSDSGERVFPGDMDISSFEENFQSPRSFWQIWKAHWLVIFIIFFVLDAASIFMLVYISRKEKKQLLLEEKEQKRSGAVASRVGKPVKKESHSHIVGIFALCVMALLVVIIKVMTAQTDTVDQTEATVYSDTAELGEISSVVPGAGTLTDETAVELELPANVEITKWYVSNGDTVAEGDKLAQVDSVSVMSAIVEVQEKMAALDEKLEEHEEEEISDTITASTDGKVKVIYAQDGAAVLDTMYENGALMLISMDGMMSVSIETEAAVSAGDIVSVTLSDNTVLSGKVQNMTNGTAVITVSDDEADYGEIVTAAMEDGTVIGSGELFIHSELRITGFTGTVSDVEVSVDEEVESGDTLLTLTDTDYTGEYELLLAQRQELETQMQELFRLYQENYVYASCAGVISGLDATELAEVGSDNSADTDSENIDNTDAESAESTDTESAEATQTTYNGTSSAKSQNQSGGFASMSYKSDGGVKIITCSTSADAAVTTGSGVTNGIRTVSQSNSEAGIDLSSDTGSDSETGSGTESGSGSVSGSGSGTEGGSGTGTGTEGGSGTGSGTEGGSGTGSGSGSGTEGGSGTGTGTEGGSGTGSGTEGGSGSGSGTGTGSGSGSGTEGGSGTGSGTEGGSGSGSGTGSETGTEGETGSGNNGGATGAYTNYIGVVTSVETNDEGTMQVSLRMLNAQMGDPAAVSQFTLSSGLTVYTFSSGKCVVGTASDIQTNDTLMLIYDSSSPLFCIRISGESDQSQTSGSMAENQNGAGMSGTDFSGAASGSTGGQSQMSGMSGSMTTGAALAAASEAVQAVEMMEEEIAENYGVTTTSWLSITPQDTMEITITIDEMDILLLEEGQDALVTLDAFPGQSFDGTVTAINLSGVNSGGSSKYEAVISINRMEDMLAGMNASVSITVDTKEDILMIPVEALEEDETGLYVYTSYDEETEQFGDRVLVTTGISDGKNVEILSGLSEGSEYWYSSLDVVNYATLSSGNNGSFSFGSMFGGNGGRGR